MRNIVRQKIIDFQEAPFPGITRRDVHLPVVPGKAIAVIGMRRTGKTCFLWQVIADRARQGAGRERTLLFNFEDDRLAGMTADDLHWVADEFFRLYPEGRDRDRTLFCLDEVQAVPGWETFVRRLLDTENIELFLSGSSARLLSREVATSMRGRSMEALVHPFSFREYLRHHGKEPEAGTERLSKAVLSSLNHKLPAYLASGGFPEAQGLTGRDRFELLRGYVDVALFRDVVERHAVSQPTALRWLTRQLLGNAAGLFSINKYANDMRSQGISVGKDTLHAFLAHLEDAFLVRTIGIASTSERQRRVNPRKVYPIDPGLIPVFDRSGRANIGHALETAVLLSLDRRGAELAYAKSPEGYEVDFLARFPDGRQELIQVCADPDDPGTVDRELRALSAGARELPAAGLRLVTLFPEAVKETPAGVKVHSAVDWLLSE
ncbi:MAG: ATP-binding protein [Acidobacteria bacterium]|nr:ATP-binding protein [Acidobacteriota bacterium]